MSIIQSTAKSGGTGGFYDFPIGQSLRFDGSSYLSRSQTSGSRTTMTYSLWVKRSNTAEGHLFYDGNASNAESSFYFVDGRVQVEYYHGSGASYFRRSVDQLRDLSAWYHLVFVMDTSNATANNRFKIYVNSVEITDDAYTPPTQSLATDFNENGSTVFIGARTSSTINFNGYLANIQFVDGSALTPTSFGETKNGVWVPKAYTGSYGTNGFHLDFRDATSTTTLGYDYSGNNNHWTLN